MPHNPTGSNFSIANVKKILENFQEKLIILDQAYIEFSSTNYSVLINDYCNLAITNSMSKALGIASLRVGTILAREEILDIIHKLNCY